MSLRTSNLYAALVAALLLASNSGFSHAAGDRCSDCCDCPTPITQDCPTSADASITPDGLSGVESDLNTDSPVLPSTPIDFGQNSSPQSNQFSMNPLAQTGRGGARSQSFGAPNMIGDTSAGGCGGLRVTDLVAATLNHPIYACSRLNIAENNSAAVRDRFYVTYRHFHNASGFDFFSNDPLNGGLARDFDINQYTFAVEKRVGRFSSIEIRLPITSQLTSDIDIVQNPLSPSPDGRPNNLALIGTDADIGNVSVIFKQVLRENSRRIWSWGLGVNTPTAPDLSISGDIDSTINGSAIDFDFDGVYRNQTVNLQPFVAYLKKPVNGWFSQGFLQFDVPLNASEGFLDVAGGSADIEIQSLVRANLGVGKWIGDSSDRSKLKNAISFELHYSGTLEGPDRREVSLEVDGNLTNGPLGDGDDVTLLVGPLANSTNSLNGVIGLATSIHKTTFYNGFTFPFRDGSDRGFDFEYSLTIDRQF